MDGKKRMRPGSPVTIYDVARKAKVSITTVSNVINDKDNIPEVTRKKVREAIRSLDFTPNKIAQRLVTKRTQTIALLIPTMENPFFAELYNGIEGYIESDRPEYKIMIGNIGYSEEKERELIGRFRREFFDGYIMVSNNPDNLEARGLMKSEIPLVFAAGDPSEAGGRPLVTYNNYEMAYDATRYLAELGHRRFGYIAGTFRQSSRSQSRYRGFVECLNDRGISTERRLFVEGGTYTSKCGYESFRELARKGEVPTALFCANDVLAIGALAAIREAGLKIPGDISVVGFDNIPASAYVDPPLTTVSINPAEIGSESARLLFGIIDGKKERDTMKMIGGELVVRKSCAPPKR